MEENEYIEHQIQVDDFGTEKHISISKKEEIKKYISEKNYKASIGYYDIKSKDIFYYNPDKIYYGASLIKTLDAIYLYDKNLVTEEIEPYIKKTISISDNKAHEYIVKYIGRENLKNYGLQIGAKNTLQRKGDFGDTTIEDQMIYMKKLYSMIEENEKLKSYFINDYGNYMKIDNVINLHKYGYFNNYFHDVGIFLCDNPYILVILTEHGKDDYKSIIKDISNLIYKYHIG